MVKSAAEGAGNGVCILAFASYRAPPPDPGAKAILFDPIFDISEMARMKVCSISPLYQVTPLTSHNTPLVDSKIHGYVLSAPQQHNK